jgi:hypothetical protein
VLDRALPLARSPGHRGQTQSLYFAALAGTFAVHTIGDGKCANTGHSSAACRTGNFNPPLPFAVGPMNKRKCEVAQEQPNGSRPVVEKPSLPPSEAIAKPNTISLAFVRNSSALLPPSNEARS